MNRIDAKSTMIGMLLCAVLALGIAAVADMHSGRYNISICAGTTPGTFLICVGDTATGRYSVERCLEQIPASSSMMTHIGIYQNPLKEPQTE